MLWVLYEYGHIALDGRELNKERYITPFHCVCGPSVIHQVVYSKTQYSMRMCLSWEWIAAELFIEGGIS